MKLGKNQIALLKFLNKYPNKWHKIKGRKAIDAAKRLEHRKDYVSFIDSCNKVRLSAIPKNHSL